MTPALKIFFYHSRLAPGLPYTAVGKIISTARRFNALHGITGLLVFDGERFCQFIEGPPTEIDTLVKRLRDDTRHTDFTVLIGDAFADERRYAQWSMAYASMVGDEYLDDLLSRPADDALLRLQATIDQLDVN